MSKYDGPMGVFEGMEDTQKKPSKKAVEVAGLTGVTENMLPGNTPEDEAYDRFVDDLLDALTVNQIDPTEYDIIIKTGIAAVMAHREAEEKARKIRISEGRILNDCDCGCCPQCARNT